MTRNNSGLRSVIDALAKPGDWQKDGEGHQQIGRGRAQGFIDFLTDPANGFDGARQLKTMVGKWEQLVQDNARLVDTANKLVPDRLTGKGYYYGAVSHGSSEMLHSRSTAAIADVATEVFIRNRDKPEMREALRRAGVDPDTVNLSENRGDLVQVGQHFIDRIVFLVNQALTSKGQEPERK